MNANYRALRLRQITASDRAAYIPARMRQTLMAAPTFIMRTVQSCRALVHFGPWRHIARAAIRISRPPQKDADVQTLPLFRVNSAQLVKTIRAHGVAAAGMLPPYVLGRVRAITDKLPPGEYGDFHEIPDVRTLVECAAIVGIPRSYFQAEPELLECNLVVAQAENPDNLLPYDSQRRFHFDYAGWHSLNLFIYLTDVSPDSGAHQVIIGTHRSHNAWDAVRGAIPDDELEHRFPSRLRTITGPAGTMFFEDTSAFHRRQMHTRRRVMLNILYASHRGWLSKGRLVPKYSDFFRSH